MSKRYRGREVALPVAQPPAAPPPPPAVAQPAAVVVAPPVQMYTLEVAALRLAVCHETLLRAIRKGSVHAVKIGRHWRVSEAELRRVSVEGAEETTRTKQHA